MLPTEIKRAQIETRLAAFFDPDLGVSLSQANTSFKVMITNERIQIEIVLGYPHQNSKEKKIIALKDWLKEVVEGKELIIELSQRIEPHVGKQGTSSLSSVKNIIAVASGKGGVGKSTVAVNLALALQKEGAQVGLLDADIYGPSQPTMLGVKNEKPLIDNKRFQPIIRYGLQTMSIGYLVDADTALAWRGPMIGKALQQMFYDTNWQSLDYLIIDLPPGTGDIQLTLCQKIPVSAAVMVTTPQDLALLDVRRACDMFQKLSVPILGVIENMSYYHCSQCGHPEPIFGEGGAQKLAKEYDLTLLQQIPLALSIRETTDAGHPIVVQVEENPSSNDFYQLARKVGAKLSLQPKDYSSKFPKVVVM